MKGNPTIDAVLHQPNPAFAAWVATLPAEHWARCDLSAARLGFEAGAKDALKPKCNCAHYTHLNVTEHEDFCPLSDEARSLASEVAGLRAIEKAARQWQPIATAPQDGSEFLATKRHGSQWDTHILRVDDGRLDPEYYQGWDLEDYTHWMRLPEAPK